MTVNHADAAGKGPLRPPHLGVEPTAVANIVKAEEQETILVGIEPQVEICPPVVFLAAVHRLHAGLHMRAAEAAHHTVRPLRYFPGVMQRRLQIRRRLGIRHNAFQARRHAVDPLARRREIGDGQPKIRRRPPIAGKIVD